MNKHICTFLFVLWGFSSTDACAHSVRSREAQVIVQSINRQTRTLTLRSEQGRGPQLVRWKADSQFLRDGKVVSAAELEEGNHATLYYQSPFFGKPFLVKVVWSARPDSRSGVAAPPP